jgi:hypothetical protein
VTIVVIVAVCTAAGLQHYEPLLAQPELDTDTDNEVTLRSDHGLSGLMQNWLPANLIDEWRDGQG